MTRSLSPQPEEGPFATTYQPIVVRDGPRCDAPMSRMIFIDQTSRGPPWIRSLFLASRTRYSARHARSEPRIHTYQKGHSVIKRPCSVWQFWSFRLEER